MPISRREFIKAAGMGVGTALLAAESGLAAKPVTDPNTHVSMLYDATLCVGCNACTMACRQWNGTSPEVSQDGLYDAPKELSADTWTIIQLYQGSGEFSFVKRQCMHCIEPGCVSGCPVHALQKTEAGPVTYDPDRCIGCRYCMYTCPFHIPRFEWDELLPEVTKCTLCTDRLASGDGPACAERCPTGALVWGKRGELLAEAHRRLEATPQKYHPHVYGENDAGGTSVLYLSAVPFEMLGLPTLGVESVPTLSERTGNLFIPSILIGGPLVLTTIRMIANRNGWD